MIDRPAAGHRALRHRRRTRLVATLAGLTLLAGVLPSASASSTAALVAERVRPLAPAVTARERSPEEAAAIAETLEAQPSILYEEAMAHAHDRIAFEPGARVDVGFRPAADDRWEIDGRAPRPLPAGRVTGRDLARAAQGSVWADPGAGLATAPAAPAGPAATPEPRWPASGSRCWASCRTGRSTAPPPRSTTGCSRRSRTSPSGPTRTATS
jgi:hypothetical protein